MEDNKTLLELAREAAGSTRGRKTVCTKDDFDLLDAYIHGEISMKQIDAAIEKQGKSRQNSHQTLARIALAGIRQGAYIRLEA